MKEFGYHSELLSLISHLSMAITSSRLYFSDHPQAIRSRETAYNRLAELLLPKREISFFLIDDDLVVDRRPLRTDAPYVRQFRNILRENAIECMTFLKGLQEVDFCNLIHDLALPKQNALRRSPFVKFGTVDLRVKKEAPDASGLERDNEDEQVERLVEARDLRYEELKALYSEAKRRKRIDMRIVDDMIKLFVRGFVRGINPLALLASLRSSDEYTFTHVVNVCILTMSQAESLGFTGNNLYEIGVASLLHDVGKLFVPEEIIKKPGALTPEERKIVETHTVSGARYVLQLNNVPKLAVLGAFEHHLRYDGTGYPSVKGGWQPNIVSQIIGIADVFDALRSRRPYSEPKPQEVIVRLFEEEKGKTFHPLLVDNFLNLIAR